LLRGWLYKEHVRRWWVEPESRLAECLKKPDGGDHALICFSSNPVGYIRWQKPSTEELERVGLAEIYHNAFDIDMFIGEEKDIGRGIGPEALTILLKRLANDPVLSIVGLGTSQFNRAAIRAFEKAGFKKHRKFDDPIYGKCWLMIYEISRDHR
jgi:aminoglycoside 6'-N-acetyltransferase